MTQKSEAEFTRRVAEVIYGSLKNAGLIQEGEKDLADAMARDLYDKVIATLVAQAASPPLMTLRKDLGDLMRRTGLTIDGDDVSAVDAMIVSGARNHYDIGVNNDD